MTATQNLALAHKAEYDTPPPTEIDKLIVIEQLPVIREYLAVMGEKIDADVSAALDLDCTEETVKKVKAERARLTKEFEELESRRKLVKNAVMSPYEAFEEVYREHISSKYNAADAELKKRIGEVEGELKAQTREKAEAFWHELCNAKKVDFIGLQQTGIAINLSTRATAVKKALNEYMGRVVADINMIESLGEHQDEIMVEYRRTLNAAQAILTVRNRHKALDEQIKRNEALREARQADAAASAKVAAALEQTAPLAAPTVRREATPDPVKTLSFTVSAPVSKLKELKKFLAEGGYTIHE